MRTAFGKLSALAFVLILGILLAAPMRAGQEDRLIPGVRSVRMDPGDTYTLQYTLRADQAQAVSFSSEDSSIAEVSTDGLVTAIAPGRTRLRLLARGGASATVDVEISGVPVTLFELNTRELVMEKGDVSGLSCRFNQGATDQRVEWMSSNPDIVRVDAAGRVTAVSAGETYVVATTPSGLSAAARVKVQVRGTVVQIVPGDLTVGVGATFPLQTHYLPEDTTDEVVGWKSDDPSVLSVNDSGVVHAVSVGTATISVQTRDGLIGTTAIRVEAAAKDFQVNPTAITIERGDAHALEASFLNADGQIDSSVQHHVEWSSSNPAVVTVADGQVTAVSSGTAYVTASADGFQSVCTVRVQTTVHAVSLDMQELYLLREQATEPFQLKATLTPADADDLKLTYTSDNPLVATVSANGMVTPTGGYGTAVITVASSSGAEATFTLSVVTALPETSAQDAASVETEIVPAE